MPVLASAQDFRYSIELDIPESYRALLEQYLDIYKWRDNPRMNEDQLRLLLRKAPDNTRELLSTEGFYSPTIDSSLEGKDGAWVVSFTVEPGEPVRVVRFDLEVRGDFEDGPEENALRLQKLHEVWPLQPGSVFRQAEWEAAKRSALKELLIEQYPAATISASQATVNPDTREVVLYLALDSGPAFTFGALEVAGLSRYPRSIIDRLSPIGEGAPYSQTRLLDFQSRLQDSPYFSSALVSMETDPLRPEHVPVRVEITERPARRIGFGIGASTNTGGRGQVEYENLDFLGQAWRLTSLLKLETNRQFLKGEILVPRTAGGYLDSLDVFTESSDIEGEDITKYGLGTKRTRVVGKIETTLAIQYQTEQQKVLGAEENQRQALSLNYAWARRDLDNLLYPTRGYLLSTQVGGAGKALLSDQSFARSYLKAAYYYPLGEQDSLLVRGELGMVAASSRQGIPSDFLFRTGGDQSVRGYDYLSLGVKQGNAVVGGRYLGVASVEYVHWLRPKWGAAVFYDVGNAADDLASFRLAHGYGLGARWKSPVGPLNVDVAYGRDQASLQLHFSVGVAF
ncbi:MAG: autotransporter assembly complex family protein [Gammaproteobacteria bacterium]|nr:autotransporter assembly complex family protein [Gammaproteobacteria bacterium]